MVNAEDKTLGKKEQIALLNSSGSILSILLIVFIALCNPPLIENQDFFAIPALGTLFCLGILLVFFYYVWQGLLVIKYKKRIAWKKLSGVLAFYGLFVLIGFIAVTCSMASGHITGYVYYKEDAWDTFQHCFAPIYLFEKPLYYLPFVLAVILIINYLNRDNLFVRYAIKLLPFLMAMQMVVILHFSYCERGEKKFVNGAENIPAQLIQYMPK